MNFLSKTFLACAVSGALAFAAAGPGFAAGGVKIGSLQCTVNGGIGLILGSSKGMRCAYFPAGGGPVEYYSGSVNKFGLDIGITKKAKMGWVVFAPGRINRGALGGTYVGAAADASLGIGGGAKVLVGGFNRSVTLQPVSLQVQTGLNVAAGISSMNLHAE